MAFEPGTKPDRPRDRVRQNNIIYYSWRLLIVKDVMAEWSNALD